MRSVVVVLDLLAEQVQPRIHGRYIRGRGRCRDRCAVRKCRRAVELAGPADGSRPTANLQLVVNKRAGFVAQFADDAKRMPETIFRMGAAVV